MNELVHSVSAGNMEEHQEVRAPRRHPSTRAREWFLRIARHDRTFLVAAFIVVALAALGVLADLVAPYPADSGANTQPEFRLLPPSSKHWMGTDELGRDVLTRLIFGIRVSLIITVTTVALTAVVGVPLGTVAAYSDKWWSAGIMRLADVFLAIPLIVLAILFVTLLGRGVINLIISLVIVLWPVYARLAYASTLSVREREFVTAARALGATDWRIVGRHVLPNIAAVVVVQASLDLGRVILFAAGLSFIGLGPPVPMPELGAMIEASRQYVTQGWWTGFFPGLTIFLLAVSFNIIGDSLNESRYGSLGSLI